MPATTRIVRILTRMNIGGPSVHAALLSTQLPPGRFSTCLILGEPAAGEGDLSDLARGASVRVVKIATLGRSINPVADLRTLIRIFRVLQQQRPHVIHTHMAKAGALGRVAGWLYNHWGHGRRPGARAALVHTFHGHVLNGYFPAWISQGFLLIERWLARGTDRLIAVSRTIQDDLLARGVGRPQQWRVVPLGIDLSSLSRLPLREAAAPVRCGMVGRLVPIKNPGLFLQAFERLSGRIGSPGLSAMVVGDGPLRLELQAQAQRLGLDQTVEFTGWQRDLSSVYGALDLVCLTSWNEGTPVTAIEAMAAGRAVVATDVGGVRDVLGVEDAGERAAGEIAPGTFQIAHRGILVRPGDVEGFAAALERLVTDAPLRRRLGESARGDTLQRFSPERLLDNMTRLYEELRAEQP